MRVIMPSLIIIMKILFTCPSMAENETENR